MFFGGFGLVVFFRGFLFIYFAGLFLGVFLGFRVLRVELLIRNSIECV